jgi:hypothetical protein
MVKAGLRAGQQQSAAGEILGEMAIVAALASG